jgi:hypothetical protein
MPGPLPELAFKHDLVRPAVLDVFGTCNNDAGAAIDIGPGERSNLTLSPRSDIGESREVPQVFWQRGNHGIKLRTFKEPLADIFFREPTNVWGRDDFTALDTKFDGLSEQLCLPVDGSRRPPVFLQMELSRMVLPRWDTESTTYCLAGR